MSYEHGTPFLDLPQTVGTDHRDWFDTNAAFLALDAKMKTLWDGATATADILEQLQETVSGLDTDVSALQTIVDGHTTTLQTVNESLVLINSALTALNSDVHTKFDSAGIADPYDPTYGIYAVGDVVTYNGQRYKCVTAVAAAEPFDADKWLAEDIQTVVEGLNYKEITIEGDGTSTTLTSLLNSLHARIEQFGVISGDSFIEIGSNIYNFSAYNSDNGVYIFNREQTTASSVVSDTLEVRTSGSENYRCVLNTSGATFSTRGTTTPTSVKLYYKLS